MENDTQNTPENRLKPNTIRALKSRILTQQKNKQNVRVDIYVFCENKLHISISGHVKSVTVVTLSHILLPLQENLDFGRQNDYDYFFLEIFSAK